MIVIGLLLFYASHFVRKFTNPKHRDENRAVFFFSCFSMSVCSSAQTHKRKERPLLQLQLELSVFFLSARLCDLFHLCECTANNSQQSRRVGIFAPVRGMPIKEKLLPVILSSQISFFPSSSSILCLKLLDKRSFLFAADTLQRVMSKKGLLLAVRYSS